MMRVTLFGTRGSIAAPGPETVRYGGNTSTVEVRGNDGTVLVLDAGTGIRRLGAQIPPDIARVDILLTHLHMDHIQGLGFFGPLYHPGKSHRLGKGQPAPAIRHGASGRHPSSAAGATFTFPPAGAPRATRSRHHRRQRASGPAHAFRGRASPTRLPCLRSAR
jgi:glyoxylase-like metal-dependent hydrolase (beta-lactamase superfamily II)